jgi:hypothetical protein
MFNFDQAIKEAAQLQNPYLSAIILGCSGAGKSSLLGTAGVKTLYLYTSGEDHGVKAAQASDGAEIVPLCLDFADGKRLNADETYGRLLAVIAEHDQLKAAKIQMVAVDGASEIEAIIRQTKQWKDACQTTQGKHNKFAEPEATISMFRPLLNGLKDLQRKIGAHSAMTCMLDVKALGTSGEIEEAMPRLLGYSVAEDLIRQFSDVLVVGKMQRDDKIKYKIQTLVDLSKVSKDDKGNLKKTMNFSVRLSGKRDLPPYFDASLADIIAFKAK